MTKRFFQDKKEKDLFEDFQAADKQIRKKVRLNLPRLKNRVSLSYENIIFLAIGFVMASVILFSLGVEKGRNDSNGAKVVKHRSIKEEKAKKIVPKKEIKKERSSQDKYIIQLAAFKEKNSAKKELRQLEKDGYTGGIKKSGTYYQLYIAGFTRKKEAENVVKSLQEKYKDCYVKKL